MRRKLFFERSCRRLVPRVRDHRRDPCRVADFRIGRDADSGVVRKLSEPSCDVADATDAGTAARDDNAGRERSAPTERSEMFVDEHEHRDKTHRDDVVDLLARIHLPRGARASRVQLLQARCGIRGRCRRLCGLNPWGTLLPRLGCLRHRRR